ncbi:MAG: 2-C-methyl-D-erythritol 2,4-cyclodiphosphate synthase [Candidatus Dadabacteria bacterium]|nr:2-C-methyl-D-erythritol 2,4-cyclodiphosphate synthase [Candidatus Dadabacteria bacterium]
MKQRVGIGFDAHRFASGRPLFLGCVEIPFKKGLAGHSDADALAHAICDSLLGAAGLGDIGTHFPDSDPAYRDAAGAFLIEQTLGKVSGAGFAVVNVDCVVICEEPRISPHTAEMRKQISALLQIAEDRVSVKATTTEKMGFAGRGEGVAAKAVCLIEEKS